MNGPHIWLAVAFGGALGAMARHGAGRAALALLGPHFPWGTLFVNIAGSFAMGVAIVWLSRHEPQSAALRAFLTVGVLGAFTTFSTFSLDAVTLYRDQSITVAAAYIGASVVFSIGALSAGLISARQFL